MIKEKIKVATMGVVAVFIICLIGWGIFTAFTTSLGSSDSYATQNTTSAIDASNTVFSIGGVLLIPLAVIAIIMILVYFSSTPERFENIGKIAEFLVDATYYFGYGLLAIVIVVLPAYLIYLLYNYTVLDGHAGEVVPVLKWIGIIVVAFFAISALGYGFKKKIVNKFSERFKEKEIKKNMEELPKVN